MTYETYFPEVDDLAEFIFNAKKEGKDIICQCEYGESRSSGCAAAIHEYFYKDGIKIFADYRYYPNQMVYHKVYDALERWETLYWRVELYFSGKNESKENEFLSPMYAYIMNKDGEIQYFIHEKFFEII